MFSVACVSFDGNQCRIHLKHFSQLWEAILWNRTRQHRGSYPTLHTSPNRPHPVLIRKRSGSHPQANSVSPASQSPPPPSCGSRCLLQKTSPPHSHQEHSCPLPSKQLIPSFLPCAGSSQTHLSAAVWVVMGKERRAELGCCCCHCWKPWWAEASALSRGCPSSSSSHSALLFPAVAETKLSWSVSKTLGYMEADLMQATSLDHASLTSWKEKNKKHNFSPLILGPAVLPVYSKTQRMTAESGSQFWPLWKW